MKKPKWATMPLLPIEPCPECGKPKPDIVYKDGKWVRPHKNTVFCSIRCHERSRGVGGICWVNMRHPGVARCFENGGLAKGVRLG